MNFSLKDILSAGDYFGRLIAIGLTLSGQKIFVLYGLTGRSQTSRSRRLIQKPDGIYTEPISDQALNLQNKDLLIYPAVLIDWGLAVSNGQQTRDIAHQLSLKIDDPEIILKNALANWSYEPDRPTFTPRISACLTPGGKLAMALIKRGKKGEKVSEYYSPRLSPGEGYLLATYQGPNLQPPPSFSGPPLNFSLQSQQAKEILVEFFEALAPKEGKEDWRIAAAAVVLSFPNLETKEIEIINRF
ncbi:MAG: hypothetical protein N3B16_08175 [Candidatus Aminicenantes bacterium]|nr:hypothetical protein [Candidatus Aminicenantes bacterium]